MADAQEFLKEFLPIQGCLMSLILAKGVRGHDADDLLQESASFMLEHIDEYESGTNFKSWAYAITRNKVLSYFRKQKQQQKKRCQLHLDDIAAQDIDDHIMEFSEEIKLHALRGCLSKIKGKSASLIQLHYSEGKSAKEIADEQNRSAMSIRTLLSRIRKKIRECVELQIKTENEAL